MPRPKPRENRTCGYHAPVVGSGEPIRACPVCGTPPRGRQRSACSGRCGAAKTRRRRTEAQSERDQQVRDLLDAAVRILREGRCRSPCPGGEGDGE